jgi:hypothetical protein
MTRKHYDRVVCADGFAMSVQASVYNYCQPQQSGAPKYDLVEVGFPTAEESILMPYAETPEDPTGTVYAYVPVELVTNVIIKHGGMISGEVPPGVIPIVLRA